MTDSKKISYKQLAVLMVISRLFADVVGHDPAGSEYSMQRFTVVILSCVILFLLYLPLIFLAVRHPGESAISLIAEKSRALGWLCGSAIAVTLLISSINAICSMSFYSTGTIFVQASPVLLIILPLLVCAAAAWKGIQGIARSGVIFGAVFVGFLLLIAVSVWERFDWGWLYPAFLEEPGRLFGQVLRQVGESSEILVFAVLMEHVSEKTAHAVYWYIPAVMVLQSLMLLVEILVLGPFLSNAAFPFFTISALSDIVLFQRLDGINVAVWTLMCITKLTVMLISIRTVFTRLAGETAGKVSVWASLAITAGVSVTLGSDIEFTADLQKILLSCIPLLAGGVLVPVIALIAARMRKKPEGGVVSEKSI